MSVLKDWIRIFDLVTVGCIFFIVGLVTIDCFPDVSSLSASLNTPWGVFTSNFVYDGFGNVFWYFWYAIPITFAGVFYDPSSQRRRLDIIIEIMFISGILANVVYFADLYAHSDTGNSYGQSGVGYGLIGSAAVFALFDLLNIWKRFRKVKIARLRLNSNVSRVIISGMSALFVLTTVVVTYVNSPSVFWAEGPKTNVLVHVVSFLIGSLTSIIYLGFYKPDPWVTTIGNSETQA